ncbi:MAG: hypothetical protein DWQ47_14600 [Acidobacteria bacterium]|nr:MAG: hypothetical protein DWQ32_02000 [Acidobacteriota bacterium]REK02704.1 MAG: hypothetical protein DWQ38_10135 [Acidobacteriota bacterium]REK13491.1 MAG: hypothetical protein DWQ43_07690 [Acidobacteriota bacterium]REK41485.1 MAG: hypothetical protein DWQ47_14600 [Acidobacteriota bacterium]
MKICPTCNKEFPSYYEVCPEDETKLTAAGAAEAATAEEESADTQAAEDVKTGASAAASSQSAGMTTGGKAMIVLLVVLAVGAGLVFWNSTVAGGHGSADLSHLTEEDMQLLVKDFNPMQLKALAENPEQKKQLVENLEQLLSIASQAKKEGIADKPEVKSELENMRVTLLAMNYDRKINADKGPMPQFGFISEDRVKEFWGEDGTEEAAAPAQDTNSNTNAAQTSNTDPAPAPAPKPAKEAGFVESALDVIGLGWVVGNADARRHEMEFKKFLDAKLELLRQRGQFGADQEPSDEDIKQARDAFAKTRIYYEEAKDKIASIGSMPEAEAKEWEEFEKEFELQAKLQQAQFLVQTYVQEKLSKQLQVTDEEVKKYIEEHPEITQDEEKKKKAQEVLQKVNEGGDFAELAKEFSEDPGSKDNGGLYENIAKGQFAPEFEEAALKLEPGQVTPEPVKTDFGYHIIKLEKKGQGNIGEGTGETYDARHILISTMIKDPDNPLARELPVEEFVKRKLEQEKQEKILEEIKANNPVTVPADFEVPQPSAEELERIQKQQEEQFRQMLEQNQQAPNPEGEGEGTGSGSGSDEEE